MGDFLHCSIAPTRQHNEAVTILSIVFNIMKLT